MTLLEAVISLGISAILMSATASMFLSQQKENKALQQKLETVDLKNQIMQGFINPNNCTWQLSGKTFNTTGVTATNPSSTVISLTELRQGPNTSSFLIAATGQPVPGTQTKLAVHSVTFKEIFATGNPNEYKGIFEISFTPSSMVRVIQSVRYNQIITAIGSPTASITACGAPSNDFKLGGFYTWHRHYGYCVYVNPMTGACSCPVGYTARFYNRIGYDDGTKTDDRDMGYCYKM